MNKSLRSLAIAGLALLAASGARADVVVYDDVLQNGFQNYSYNGGTSLVAGPPTHNASAFSVSFTPGFDVMAPYNAVSFSQPPVGMGGVNYDTAQYPTLHFWINGGAGSGQQLTVALEQNAMTLVTSAPLASYITGGSIAAGTWREVTVPLTMLTPAFSGTFDRIDIQNTNGAAQPTVYIDDVSLVAGGAPAMNLVQAEHDLPFDGAGYPMFLSDRYTWHDSADQLRVAVLTQNNGSAGPTAGVYANHGGSLREFRYQLPAPDNTTRICDITTYGNGGYGGFGYVVSHPNYATCIGDDSPLGYSFPGSFQRVFEGRHHVIYRFTQNYVRNCSLSAPVVQRFIPVTIDWVFSTGHDNPLWAVTYDVANGGANPADTTFEDDARGPYGEFEIDGDVGGSAFIDGVAWGDRNKFSSIDAPVTLNSAWTWTTPNLVPYVKEWIAGPISVTHTRGAEMGIVQTQTMSQQDAAGARINGFHDVTLFWGRDWMSAADNAGGAYKMPYQNDWPYQANADSISTGSGSNNARLTWRTQFGFLGRTSYDAHDPGMHMLPGYPKKSYSTYVVIGAHVDPPFPVELQVAQVETVQSLTLTVNGGIGSVVTSGPAGVADPTVVMYVPPFYGPPGYNHVYGALAFNASGANALDANIAVGAGTLTKPLLIIGNYTGSLPTVKLGGVTQVQDVDYFPSLRATANELWITLNQDLTVATNPNHLEITSGGGGCGLDVAPPVVTAPAAATVVQTLCM